MSARHALCSAIAAVALATPAVAAAAEGERVNWYLNADNDVAFHTDRWYTSGVRIYRSMPREEPGARLDMGLVQEIYTGDTNCDRCQVPDRPYAGRLLLSFARQVARSDSLTTLGADLGVLGPGAYGRQAQKFAHQLVPAPSDDWSRQLHNRFDAQLVAARSQRVLGAEDGPVSLIAHGGVVLGTVQTFAHVGGELRVGRGATSVGLTPSMRYAATPPAPLAGTARGWSAFMGLGIRSVMRNRLLRNNPDDPSPSPTRNRTVRRAAVGVAWAAPWVAITFAWVTESREFMEQHDPQRFATLSLQLDLP